MERNYDHCRQNIKYLRMAIKPNFKENNYQMTSGYFYNLNISLSSFKQAYTKSQNRPSDDTLSKIVSSFSHYLDSDIYKYLTIDSLFEDPDEFKKKFPKSKISENITIRTLRPELYIKKFYRFYYTVPNTYDVAYYGFFKLFENNGVYSARLLRGLQNEEDVQINELKNCFYGDDPNTISENFDRIMRENKNKNKKSIESFHLYEADHTNIKISPECITIEFESTDKCRMFMIWNTEISHRFSGLNSYIGGSVMCVETNNGERGKVIASFKAGLEQPENLKKALSEKHINTEEDNKNPEKTPLDLEAIDLIDILSLESRHGYQILDNADDSLWYRFLLNPKHRIKSSISYSPDQITEIAKDILSIERKQQECFDRLEKFENKLENLINKLEKL